MLFGVNLLPQEDRFYDLIGETGELAYQCVQLLHELVNEENKEKAYKLGRDIEINKARAKEMANEVTESLCKTFITPFDREDIQTLSYGLYKIPKICEKAQERILAFNLRNYQNDFFKLTKNMCEAAEPLHDMTKNLKKLKDSQMVHDKCELIHNVETNTDELLNHLTIDLFAQEADVKQVILRKDVYSLMEDIVDKQRDMANIILEIVLKHT